MSSTAAAEATSAPSSAAATATSSSIFHSKRTAALVPKDSHPRGKRALRNAIQEFADQFVNSLSRLLVDFCALRKSKTVDVNSLTRAAEDLLGEGAAKLPRGVAKEDLPQTLIFSRFKRRLGGLRTEGACAELVSIIGFNFLRYVQSGLDSVFEGQDAKAVEVDAVVRALSQPRGYSKSGLPCIAYRPGLQASSTAAVAPAAAATATPATAEAPKKSSKRSPKAAAQPEAEAEAAAAAEPEPEATAAKKKTKKAKKTDEEEPAAVPKTPKAAAPSRKRAAADSGEEAPSKVSRKKAAAKAEA
jgi:hypothetical protein